MKKVFENPVISLESLQAQEAVMLGWQWDVDTFALSGTV